MQANGADGAPSGKEEAKPEATPEEAKEEQSKTPVDASSAQINDDGWDKFYSMPPNWKKSDSTQTTSAPERREPTRTKSGLTDENIGHKLASLLRYHADENDITSDEDGWVIVAQIIKNADAVGLGGCNEEDLLRVANSNEHSTRGRRFETDDEGRIRATYRHPPKDRRDGWDRYQARMRRSRGYGGWPFWDYSRWHDSWQEWGSWKNSGFSPSPDDDNTEATSWEAAKADSTEAAASTDSKRRSQEDAAPATVGSADIATAKEPCEWEQWFTPEMEIYYYNSKTEEFFYPRDAADITEKGWARYVDGDGESQGKIYWWHDASGRSFYEDDVAADEEPEA